MRHLLPLLLLCACAGSLVDHDGVALSNPTQQCQQTCTTSPAGTTPYCDGSTCTFQCPDGQFKFADGCRAATEISAGTGHTCAVVSGEARCWGANDKGQLGRAGDASYVPVVPSGLTGTVTHIAAGSAHTCAIADGNVWCWGDDTFGQLGNGATGAAAGGPAPQQIAGISGAQAIAAGGSHTCAATASKTYCWGNDDVGQLGDGASPLPGAARPQPFEVTGAAGALALAAGDSSTCVSLASGVICWGANDKGQLGNNAFGSPVSTPPGSPILTGAALLVSGGSHSCAVAADSLSCWGANTAFQIDTSGQNQEKPRGVQSNVLLAAAGGAHTCAVTKGDTLECRGSNDQQQLGGAGTGQDWITVPLSTLQAVTAGFKHTCAIANGATYCWGLNDRGQLGADPHTVASTATPTGVSGR